MSDNIQKGFVPIEIKKRPASPPEPVETQDEDIIEVELEEFFDEPSVPPQVEETPKEEEVEVENPKQKVQKPQEKKEGKKESRAQKRIKQLHAEKVELERKLQEALKQKTSVETQLFSTSKTSKESLKGSIENQIKTLNQRLLTAMEEGNNKDVVEIQEMLFDLKAQQIEVQQELSYLSQLEKQQQKTPTEPVQQKPEVNERALEWVEDHPAFKTDELFYTASLTVNKQLLSEGFDPDSEEFYEELNTRLTPRFPEYFGEPQEDVLQYDKDTSEEDDKLEPEPTKQKPQTVSGASRSPTNTTKTARKGKNSVVLSPQAVAQAQRWGLTLEQMARRVAHNEKNRSQDGYVPILIKKP